MVVEPLQGCGLHHCPGQPGPRPEYLFSKESFPNVQSKPPLTQLEATAPHPIAGRRDQPLPPCSHLSGSSGEREGLPSASSSPEDGTISLQATLTVHHILALLTSQPHRRSLPSDLGLPEMPGWSWRSANGSRSCLLRWRLPVMTCSFELRLGGGITVIGDGFLTAAPGVGGRGRLRPWARARYLQQRLSVAPGEIRRTVIENGCYGFISPQNVQQKKKTWKSESWMHDTLHKLPIKNFPQCAKLILIYLLHCCF